MALSRHLYTSVGTELPSLSVAQGEATTLDTGAFGRFSALLLKEMRRSNRLLSDLQGGARMPNPGAVLDPTTGASCSSTALVYHHLIERPLAAPRSASRGLLPKGSVATFLGIEGELVEQLARCGKPFCGVCLTEGKRSTNEDLQRFQEGVAGTLVVSFPLKLANREAYPRILELFSATRVVADGQLLRAEDFNEGGQGSVVLESVGSGSLQEVVGRWSESLELLEVHEVSGREVVRSIEFHSGYRCPRCFRALPERFDLKERTLCTRCEGRGCEECFRSGSAREGQHFCLPLTPLDTLRLGGIALSELERFGGPSLELFDIGAVTIGDRLLDLNYSTRALLTLTRLLSAQPTGQVIVFDHFLSMVAPHRRGGVDDALLTLAHQNGVLVLEEGEIQEREVHTDVLSSLRERRFVALHEGDLIPSISELRNELKVARSLQLQLDDFRHDLRIFELGNLLLMLGEIVARGAGGRVIGITSLDLHPRRSRFSCPECKGVGTIRDSLRKEVVCSSCSGLGLGTNILSLRLPWEQTIREAFQVPLRELLERAREEAALSSVLESVISVGDGEDCLATDLSFRTLPYAQRVWVAAETTSVCMQGGSSLLLLKGVCTGLSQKNRGRILELLKKFASYGHYVVLVEDSWG